MKREMLFGLAGLVIGAVSAQTLPALWASRSSASADGAATVVALGADVGNVMPDAQVVLPPREFTNKRAAVPQPILVNRVAAMANKPDFSVVATCWNTTVAMCDGASVAGVRLR